MKNYLVLKLIGLAVLTMLTLVILSFLEVALYSYLIHPGQEEAIYEAHANDSAPYISSIAGLIIFFFVARFWKKKGYENAFKLALLFPLTYIVLDVILLTAFGINWEDFILVFLISNGAKLLGSFIGNKMTGSYQNGK